MILGMAVPPLGPTSESAILEEMGMRWVNGNDPSGPPYRDGTVRIHSPNPKLLLNTECHKAAKDKTTQRSVLKGFSYSSQSSQILFQ